MRRNLNIKFYNRIKGPAQCIEVKKRLTVKLKRQI